MSSHAKQFLLNLNELLVGYFSHDEFSQLENIKIMGISLDSRKIKTDYLFIAVKGEKVDGVEFINSAIERGATAVLWEAADDVSRIKLNWRKNPDDINVPIIAITNLTQLVGEFAARFYEEPSDDISVIGITGTNGKTSCADFIAQVISVDEKCGLLGTLGKGLYPDLEVTGYTTPNAIDCHEWLASLNAVNVKKAVMEVSSHALTQGRVNGIIFESAVFTNLSRDHLDFHGDMKSYLKAKATLFEFPKLKNAIINADDEAGRNIIAQLAGTIRCIRYGLDKSFNPDVYGYNLILNHDGLSMDVKTPWGEGKINSPVIGRFNASNLLVVLSVMLLQGIDFEIALNRLNKIKSVAGRMQRFGRKNMPLVIVDFAHTPDALEQVLISLRQHTQRSLWCVFGCGGDRDKGKRSLMGGIAEELADHVVLTNDNPRSEIAEEIIEDIKSGIKDVSRITIEQDRQSAIHFAISQAKSSDVVLIAGKGHENYQIVGDKKLPFNDAEEVEHQLKVCAG